MRVKAGLTQAQLAVTLDVSSNTVARWERGLVRPGKHALLRLQAMTASPADQWAALGTEDQDTPEPYHDKRDGEDW